MMNGGTNDETPEPAPAPGQEVIEQYGEQDQEWIQGTEDDTAKP